MNITLGPKIRSLRLRDGRTQEEVAVSLGVSPQAVSRWENGICYPDMELIPSIAGYFGVSIDALFSYDSDRERRLAEVTEQIRKMNAENNGEDVNVDECIALAREASAEFPGNGSVLLCLGDVLYNAGYVRHGERHFTDGDGYDRFDTELHRTYPEWQEAIAVYERLAASLPEGEERRQAHAAVRQHGPFGQGAFDRPDRSGTPCLAGNAPSADLRRGRTRGAVR